jgi:hypothetical protein
MRRSTNDKTGSPDMTARVPTEGQQPADRPAAVTISNCSAAILRYHGVDPEQFAVVRAVPRTNAIEISEVRLVDGHLALTILLPMPYGSRRMTIITGKNASISLPGMELSPEVAAAAVGRPVGRLLGHPAFENLTEVLVTEVLLVVEVGQRPTTILRFKDQVKLLNAADIATRSYN